MNTKPIPLFALPYLAYAKVFHYMDPYHQISISLLSKRAKAFVKFMNNKAELSTCQIGTDITLIANWANSSAIFRIYLLPTEDRSFLKNLNDFEVEHVDFQRFERGNFEVAELQKWKNVGWGVKDYINHFNDMVNKTDGFDILRFCDGAFRYEAKSVRDTVGKFQQLTFIDGRQGNFFLRKVLDTFLPVTKQYIALQNPYESLEVFAKVLSQQFDSLVVNTIESFRCTLTDLLGMKSRSVVINWSELKEMDLNQFFKLWIENQASKDLEYLMLSNSIQLTMERILEGINYQQSGSEEQRTFIHSKHVFSMGQTRAKVNYKKFRGGLDIRRCDGKLGTVHFDNTGFRQTIQFFVWN